MVDRRALQAAGCTAKEWKKVFDLKGGKKKLDSESKPEQLRKRIWSRCDAGRDFNLQNFRIFQGLDLIWNTPFRQMSPTLLVGIIDKCKGKTPEEANSVLKSYGFDLNDLLIKTGEIDQKTNKPIYKISVPAFYSVMIPMVRAYTEIRESTLVNARNKDPLYYYYPFVFTQEDRARCEVLNSRMKVMAKQYDYLGAFTQSVFQMLLYPYAVKFTLEEWHTEKQQTTQDGKKFDETIVKEGLRYHLPHPARIWWDFSYPLESLNTDSGCSFVGFWKVMQYRELSASGSGFYNLDKVSLGDGKWWGSATSFLDAIYPTCIIAPPSVPALPSNVPEADRETWLAENSVYGADKGDKSVSLFEYREKLIPSEWGLGKYKYPIWTRFVIAGDGTIIYAAPVCYTPATVYKDNGDAKLRMDASLALKLTPFQDQLSNLFTQYLLAVKQNLGNLVLIDKNTLEDEEIKTLKNIGEQYYRGVNMVFFDSKKANRFQVNTEKAVQTHKFSLLNTSEILQAIRSTIDLAERVLGFSSQEVAQAASHEQTKAEIEGIQSSTTNTLEFEGVAVDRGMEADAHQQYEAFVNYGEDEFTVHIPSEIGLTPEQLKKMELSNDEEYQSDQRMIRVKAKKSAVMLLQFACMREAKNRATNWEAAQALGTFLRDLLSNPMTQMAIGPDQAVRLANHIAKLGGIELDQELRNVMPKGAEGGPPQQPQQPPPQQEPPVTMEVLVQILKQLNEQMSEEFKKALAPIMQALDAVTKRVEATEQLTAELTNAITTQAQRIPGPEQIPLAGPPEILPGMAPAPIEGIVPPLPVGPPVGMPVEGMPAPVGIS